MFVLEMTNGPQKGQAIGLEQGRRLVIGRSLDSDVVLEDAEISGRHAMVNWDREGFSITDLGSRNGTYVNGQRVEGTRGLTVGDLIQIGYSIIALRQADAGFRPLDSPDADVTLPRIPNADTTQMMPRVEAKTEAAVEAQTEAAVEASSDNAATEHKILAMGPQATVMAAGPAGMMFPPTASAQVTKGLEERLASERTAEAIVHVSGRYDPFFAFPITIGREQSSGIVIDDETASLRHAAIDRRDGVFSVRDVGSSNGTLVNGQRIVVRELEHGDVITVGQESMVVVLRGDVLGIDLRAPALGRTDTIERGGSAIGVIQSPLGGGKRKKKKASELVWFATSDLDRGVFRSRAAFLGLFIGVVATMYMLSAGDSRDLAGGQLMSVHESSDFDVRAGMMGRGSCTACHVGTGRISSVKCFDCHIDNRPTRAHARQDLPCVACHIDHVGADFRAAAAAALSCDKCHPTPHEALMRERPKLVDAFRRDAPADLNFHFSHHIEEQVPCGSCHQEAVDVRSTCGGCHAPDNVVAEDCHQCHRMHPDRDVPVSIAKVEPEPPPGFPLRAVGWAAGLIVLPFLLASLIPRDRKVEIS